jgi:DNA-binding MarR family transcriptional regulator
MSKQKGVKKPRYTMIWHGAKVDLKLSLQEYIIAYAIWRLSKEGTRPFKARTRREISEQLKMEKNGVFQVMRKLKIKGIINGSAEDDLDPMGYITTRKWKNVIDKYEYAYGKDEDKPENMHFTQYWNAADKDLDLSLLDYVIMHAIYIYSKKGDEWITLNQANLAKKINILPENLNRKLKELIKANEVFKDDPISGGRKLIKVSEEFSTYIKQKEEDYQPKREGE